MITKRIFAVVVASFLGCTALSATPADCYDSCDSKCDFFDKLTVGADFLYWSAYTPSLGYVKYEQPSDIDVEVNHFNYRTLYLEHYFDPGFRLYVAADDVWCGWDLSASYTRYNSTNKKTFVRGENQSVVIPYAIPGFYTLALGGPSSVVGKSDIEYQTVDILFGYDYACFGCNQSLNVFGGVEGVKLDQRERTYVNTEAQESSFTIDWKSEFKGIGLKVGSQYDWKCSDCLSIFAKGSFSVLAGDQDDRNNQTNAGTSQTRSIHDSSTICVPGLHLAAGVNYEACLCGWNFGLRAGYEFLDWWNIPQQRVYQFASQYNYTTPAAGGNLVLHGLFAGAYVTF